MIGKLRSLTNRHKKTTGVHPFQVEHPVNQFRIVLQNQHFTLRSRPPGPSSPESAAPIQAPPAILPKISMSSSLTPPQPPACADGSLSSSFAHSSGLSLPDRKTAAVGLGLVLVWAGQLRILRTLSASDPDAREVLSYCSFRVSIFEVAGQHGDTTAREYNCQWKYKLILVLK